MPFVKGQSGNPAGRKPGGPDRRRIAKLFEADGEEVTRVVLEKAKAGDLAAAALVLPRLVAPLRPKAETVQFTLDTAATLDEQGRQVLAAVAEGRLDPDSAKLLMDCLGTQAALITVAQFETRLLALERHGQSALPASSGVLLMEGPDA